MSQSPGDENARADVLELMQRTRSGALATLLDGGPYVSLVNLAPDENSEPILLLSRLAWHTRNIEADPRVSLLLTETQSRADPLTGPRVSLVGVLAGDDSPEAGSLYLSHHPAAARYAGFEDFGFYRMAVSMAHYVAGFGRIVTLTRQQLLGPAISSPAGKSSA
jgi:putative heme iron utilization protein